MLRFAFQCNSDKEKYCGCCNGCRDRKELIQQAQKVGLGEPEAQVFADMVIKNTGKPQTYSEVIASVDAACDFLYKSNKSASYKLRDWITDTPW